jgi:hypothetical protein
MKELKPFIIISNTHTLFRDSKILLEKREDKEDKTTYISHINTRIALIYLPTSIAIVYIVYAQSLSNITTLSSCAIALHIPCALLYSSQYAVGTAILLLG